MLLRHFSIDTPLSLDTDIFDVVTPFSRHYFRRHRYRRLRYFAIRLFHYSPAADYAAAAATLRRFSPPPSPRSRRFSGIEPLLSATLR